MRCPALLVLVALALGPGARAEDLAFLDGRVWLDAKVIERETTYVVVLYQKGVYTVHAKDLMPGSASMLKIRLPTKEEEAEREKADQAQRDAAATRMQREAQEEMEARERAADVQAERAAAPRPVPQIVNEYCTVVYSPRSNFVSPPSITRIQGRVRVRVPGGAIVQGDGMPTGQTYGDFGWVQGMCFIHQAGQLNATTGDSPISGRVIPAGEYRYTDSTGVVHVMRAYRF